MFPLLPGVMQPLVAFWQSFAPSCKICLRLIDSVSDSAFEEDELVLGNRQLDYVVREMKRKEMRQKSSGNAWAIVSLSWITMKHLLSRTNDSQHR